ncbi:MAG: hypothetical protein LCH39_00200 [Proteobacteria bacterium]|nr:hypothetical protein [Pseudomonadota bacterium]
MTLSRPVLVVLVAVLAIVAIGAVTAYVNERDKRGTIEIEVGKNGLKIDGR